MYLEKSRIELSIIFRFDITCYIFFSIDNESPKCFTPRATLKSREIFFLYENIALSTRKQK